MLKSFQVCVRVEDWGLFCDWPRGTNSPKHMRTAAFQTRSIVLEKGELHAAVEPHTVPTSKPHPARSPDGM